MEQTNKFQFGPALAIVIIIGVVAVAGLYFYKNILSDIVYSSDAQVTVPDGYFDTGISASSTNEDLSSSTDLQAIEADLDATIEADLTLLDEIDAQLLDYDDLDDLDFEI